MENEKYIVGRIEFSEKLPDNWVGLYLLYKEDCLRYQHALREIKSAINNMETDERDKLSEVEEIVDKAFTGE